MSRCGVRDAYTVVGKLIAEVTALSQRFKLNIRGLLADQRAFAGRVMGPHLSG
jgi:hypothetical protein